MEIDWLDAMPRPRGSRRKALDANLGGGLVEAVGRKFGPMPRLTLSITPKRSEPIEDFGHLEHTSFLRSRLALPSHHWIVSASYEDKLPSVFPFLQMNSYPLAALTVRASMKRRRQFRYLIILTCPTAITGVPSLCSLWTIVTPSHSHLEYREPDSVHCFLLKPLDVRLTFGSCPYDFSKNIVENIKENGKKLRGLEKTLSEGSPILVMGF